MANGIKKYKVLFVTNSNFAGLCLWRDNDCKLEISCLLRRPLQKQVNDVPKNKALFDKDQWKKICTGFGDNTFIPWHIKVMEFE